MRRIGDVLSMLIFVSVKNNRRQRRYSPLPVYLYLLGLLLTDTQSNLELGLFIHLHSRRWLGSSRKFIMLLFFFFLNVPFMQKASEEHVALNDSLSQKQMMLFLMNQLIFIAYPQIQRQTSTRQMSCQVTVKYIMPLI